MMSEIKPEVVERMAALVRELAAVDQSTMYGFVGEAKLVRFKEAAASRVNEARAITELLPAPVDPDLIEARRIAKEALTCPGQSATLLHNIVAGHCDAYSEVRIALAAIKRGRALATPATSA
jgi:hypothetical protein